MRPSFHPRLINGPFDDPGLYIPFQFQNRAILFDLGDIASLSSRDILKVSHAFVTHTHMDHFIGFDHLLRLILGRDKQLHLFGPSGFIDNVAGKLSGYTWNLLHNYENQLALHLHEVREQTMISTRVTVSSRFRFDAEPVQQPATGNLHSEPSLEVEALRIDHGIDCLGLCLKERFHVNIRKDRLAGLGLQTGPWLQRFKEALYRGQDPGSVFEVDASDATGAVRSFGLGELTQQIAMITPGQKISYITDSDGSAANIDRIVAFVRDSDHLFIEAAFLDQDSAIARRKKHLTAKQAGQIAGRAKVKQYSLFHYSPRYQGLEMQIEAEARQAYEDYRGS